MVDFGCLKNVTIFMNFIDVTEDLKLEIMKCDFGFVVVIQTLTIDNNPGRDFYACPSKVCCV